MVNTRGYYQSLKGLGFLSFYSGIQSCVQYKYHFCVVTSFSDLAEANQELIMVEGGISLLSMTAAEAEDPQTLRMVAGAIANLCGNGMLHSLLCFLCFIVIFLLLILSSC